MDNKEFIDILKKKLNKLDIKLEKKELEKLYDYQRMVCEWNKKVNLTAIVEENDFIEKHLVDSLTIYKYIEENMRIIDVGTGAGFPGIPLNIVKNKDNSYTLIDSVNKKINFLEVVKQELNLNNLELIHTRIEDLALNNNYRENFDIVVSRAVAPLNVLIEYMLPFLKVGGKCICMKGSNIIDEVIVAKHAIDILGGRILTIENIELPDSDIKRNIIVLEKIKKTSSIYPRKAGLPKKKPIV